MQSRTASEVSTQPLCLRSLNHGVYNTLNILVLNNGTTTIPVTIRAHRPVQQARMGIPPFHLAMITSVGPTSCPTVQRAPVRTSNTSTNHLFSLKRTTLAVRSNRAKSASYAYWRFVSTGFESLHERNSTKNRQACAQIFETARQTRAVWPSAEVKSIGFGKAVRGGLFQSRHCRAVQRMVEKLETKEKGAQNVISG